MSPRDNVFSWRSRCLDSLKRRGTRAACDALRLLAVERPEQTYLPARACSDDPSMLASALASEAATLRAEGFDIRPFVLNCSLR